MILKGREYRANDANDMQAGDKLEKQKELN
jgi:hypothetical protein